MIREVNTPELIRTTANLAQRIWNEYYVPLIGQEQVDYMLDKFQSEQSIAAQLKEGYHYFLAYEQEVALGYMGVISKDQKLMLSKLYISSAARGMGLGTSLLNQCKKVAIEWGCKAIWLTVNRHNDRSISWYQNKGFKIVDEKKLDIGKGYIMDDFILEADIEELIF